MLGVGASLGMGVGYNGIVDPRQIPALELMLLSWDIEQANDTALASWPDVSGHAQQVTQATAAAQPRYFTSGGAGFPVVRFDGVDDWLGLTTGLGMLRNVSGVTIFVLRDVTSLATARMQFFASTGTGGARVQVDANTGGQATVGGRRIDADAFVGVSGALSGVTVNTTAIQTARINYAGALAANYLNGVLSGSESAFQTPGSTSDTDSTLIRIGASNTPDRFFAGDVSAVLVYSRALAAYERLLVERYLSHKTNGAVPLEI